jgi:acyl carrier protein
VSDKTAISAKVKEFILKEFLPGEDPDELKDDTPLMTTGILDSLATLKLITFLENEYDITVEAHEADAENLNTLEDITGFVSSKLG